MKIIAMNYQRNGVSGEPFMSALINGIAGTKGTFIATFETNDKDTEINQSTCRVVDVYNHYEGWRGDQISYDIQKAFKETGLKTFYDWITKFRESAKGTLYYKVPSKRTKQQPTT